MHFILSGCHLEAQTLTSEGIWDSGSHHEFTINMGRTDMRAV